MRVAVRLGGYCLRLGGSNLPVIVGAKQKFQVIGKDAAKLLRHFSELAHTLLPHVPRAALSVEPVARMNTLISALYVESPLEDAAARAFITEHSATVAADFRR